MCCASNDGGYPLQNTKFVHQERGRCRYTPVCWSLHCTLHVPMLLPHLLSAGGMVELCYSQVLPYLPGMGGPGSNITFSERAVTAADCQLGGSCCSMQQQPAGCQLQLIF